MLTVETIGRIRREHFIKGKTIREISRDLKVSRNTVRKVLRSGETSFEYERDVQPRPKLGRWTAELDELLEGNTTKPFREQLTLIRVFEELRGRGYDGGYDAVRRYARRWAKERGQSTAAAYVPLSFAPGEAYQFDWSHEVVLLSGVTVIVKAAHVRLCHSRMLFVRAYPRETQEMVFDAHDRAFALFKGACGRGIYDNMKTAVETIFVGKGRLYNRRFLQMCSHYLVDPVACTPASGAAPLLRHPLGCYMRRHRLQNEHEATGAPALTVAEHHLLAPLLHAVDCVFDRAIGQAGHREPPSRFAGDGFGSGKWGRLHSRTPRCQHKSQRRKNQQNKSD